MRELKNQLKHERNKLDKQVDELVEHLNQQHAKQTVSDTQLALMETQFMLMETYYVLLGRRIKDLEQNE